jgi:hypothetical protein
VAEKSHYDDVYNQYHSLFTDVQYGSHQTVSAETRRGSSAGSPGQKALRDAVSKKSTAKNTGTLNGYKPLAAGDYAKQLGK